MVLTLIRVGASVAMIGVAVSAAVPVVAQQQAVPEDFLIKLERTPCFGECPAYSVVIDAKGNITYEGERFVRVTGRQTDRIPVTRVAALLETVNRIQFFDLEDRYRQPVTDNPTTFVTVLLNGRSKRIEDYLGAPKPLKEFEKQIDDAARTKRWIAIDESTLRQSLRAGWSPSADERAELLRKALQDDDVSLIKALLENGADPNGAYYRTNTTPLMMIRSAAAARALLAAGANPLAQSGSGGTALSRAVNFDPDVTKVLLSAGVPADQVDPSGRTPLWQAACAGNAGVVKLLLDRGADPTRHPAGQSALECVRRGKEYAQLYPRTDFTPPFVKDFDAVLALLEQALAKRVRK